MFHELDGFGGYHALAEDFPKVVSFQQMAKFQSPDILSLEENDYSALLKLAFHLLRLLHSSSGPAT
jgi:hypothetical protein